MHANGCAFLIRFDLDTIMPGYFISDVDDMKK